MLSLGIALAFVRLAGNAQYAYFWSLIPLAGYPAVLYLAGRRGQLTVATAPPVGVTADAEAEILVP